MQENSVEVIEHQGEPMPEASNADGPAMLFALYWPMIRTQIENLSTKSLRRLLKALICVPLEDAKLNLKLPEELQAYAICEKLLEAKLVMILTALYDNQQELQKLEIEKDSQQENKETNDGETQTTDSR